VNMNIIEILKDKRFSLRFKILNILSNDRLRNYLAVGVSTPLFKAHQHLSADEFSDAFRLKCVTEDIARARKGIEDIFQL
jgi:hypothetical protein